MTEQSMFEKSFMRPTNFFSLSSEEQYNIDKSLGILDWQGDTLSEADIVRYKNHYTVMKTIQVTEEQYELLKTFKNLLMNQDNHGTGDPVYCVQKQVTIYGMDADYASEYSWIIDSDVELSTDKELFDYLIENEYEEALKEVYYLNTEETEYSLEALEEDFLNDISCYNTDGNYEVADKIKIINNRISYILNTIQI